MEFEYPKIIIELDVDLTIEVDSAEYDGAMINYDNYVIKSEVPISFSKYTQVLICDKEVELKNVTFLGNNMFVLTVDWI